MISVTCACDVVTWKVRRKLSCLRTSCRSGPFPRPHPASNSRTTPIHCVIWLKSPVSIFGADPAYSLEFQQLRRLSPRWRRTCFAYAGKGKHMGANVHSVARKIWQTLGAIKTGVILLILVVVLSAAGTVILQRPATEAEEMQRAYSPQMLRLLDACEADRRLSCLVVRIAAESGELQHYFRLRFSASPMPGDFTRVLIRVPDETFRKALPGHVLIPVRDEETALSVAERVLQKKVSDRNGSYATTASLYSASVTAFLKWRFISCTPVCSLFSLAALSTHYSAGGDLSC